MGRKGKELSSNVKEVVRRLLEQGNSFWNVAEQLGIPFLLYYYYLLLLDIIHKFNKNFNHPVTKRTVQLHLHQHGYSRLFPKRKLL